MYQHVARTVDYFKNSSFVHYDFDSISASLPSSLSKTFSDTETGLTEGLAQFRREVLQTFDVMDSCVASRHYFSRLNSGWKREVDHLVTDEIIKRIEAMESTGLKVQILELAAGRSLPLLEKYGAPWLARKLAMAFGDKVELLVSDLNSDLIVMLVSPNGRLGAFRVITDGRDMQSMLSPYHLQAGKLKCQAFSAEHMLEKISTEQKGKDAAGSWKHIKEYCKKALPGSRFYVRPYLDSEFEQHMFGLNVRTNVNMEQISSSLTQKFDLVYARHLGDPETSHRRLRALVSAQSVLKPEGCAFVQYDPRMKGPYQDPIQIGSPFLNRTAKST